jgi:hypothetical protein
MDVLASEDPNDSLLDCLRSLTNRHSNRVNHLAATWILQRAGESPRHNNSKASRQPDGEGLQCTKVLGKPHLVCHTNHCSRPIAQRCIPVRQGLHGYTQPKRHVDTRPFLVECTFPVPMEATDKLSIPIDPELSEVSAIFEPELGILVGSGSTTPQV